MFSLCDIRHFLSPSAGAGAQFVKYGVVGVLSTLVQTGVFYLLAATVLKCLTADDWAVRFCALPAADFTGTEAWYVARGTRAALATAAGFAVAKVFCWRMNRRFVFTPGKYSPAVEFAFFFGTAAFATVVALACLKVLIDGFGCMTTIAVGVEIIVSFAVNFIIRKFVIFKR